MNMGWVGGLVLGCMAVVAAQDGGDGKRAKPRKPGSKATDEAQAPAEEDDGTPAKDLRAGDDEMKRYFLIGPHEKQKAPKAGFACLVVMPGGAGTAEFHGFVKNIWASCCPDDFVVVQLGWLGNPTAPAIVRVVR